jgi:hypothetical protein
MTHKAILSIENHEIEYLVIECSYTLTQKMDSQTGKPAEKAEPGQISFTVVAPDDSDMFFHDWMQKSNEKKSGFFDMNVVGGGGGMTFRSIQFRDAFCTSLYEYFNMHNTDQMFTRLTIFPSEVTFGYDGDNPVTFKTDDKKINANK